MKEFFSSIFDPTIYYPILNLLVGIYNISPVKDIGLVIIVLTVMIRLILSPFMHKGLKSQKVLSGLQPKMNELREKHKDDRDAQAKAMLDLYKEHKVNPLSSCLPMLVQLPIFIGLYQVFNHALKNNLDGLYSFVSNPGNIDPTFLGFVNLSEFNWPLAVLAGVAQYLQSLMIVKWQSSGTKDSMTSMMNTQMLYIFPLVTIFFSWKLNLPAGLAVYWITTTVFSIAQQYYVQRTHKPTTQEAS